MYRYAAYGLEIKSSIRLPEFPQSDGAASAVDAVFRRETLEPVSESVPGVGRRRIAAEPGRCRFSYDGIGSFLVENGDQITFDLAVDPTPEEIPRKVVRRLFANELISMLVHQRGELVLHASAVAVGDEAAIFLGPKGAGKSTTAVAFHEQGYPVLEDDLVGIRFDDTGQPLVVPGIPQVRLLPDAIDGLSLEGTSHPESDGETEKRYKTVDTVREPKPLTQCYFLETGPEIVFEAVEPQDRVVRLIAQTYTGGLLAETETVTDNFERCTTVGTTASFATLSRPADHAQLPAVVDAIVERMSA
ncbi:hypothetical protein G6M89_15145 [Natronolimnobius sp. AArcel1]|uniref:hypothetical protein n=1 Tax=Natronolimnobius sp. AArcel1 TaxID=1679093 RepID=UPI0013EAD71B|nr:hypothetical protein [Natronolimnobius sp. AArcel1]NGM70329.1 hypothetical protein [Natronolimnobius sp. AArcel1]